MSFVQAGFLIALGALAIPVLVHLLSRWQVQQVELGTMRFLREVITEASARRRIRRWLLLLLRAAIMAVLALLFARPYFSSIGSRDGDRLRIILVDRSASMSMPGTNGRLIDDALQAASSAAKELGDDATILVAVFDREVVQVESIAAIDRSPNRLVGQTDFDAAISWARDKIAEGGKTQADVVFISDLQQSGFDARVGLEDDFASLPDGVPIQVIDVGRLASHNLAISSFSTPTTIQPPGRDVTAEATLFNYGSFAFEDVDVVATASDGQRTRRTKKTVDVPHQEALEVRFDFGELSTGTWEITVEVQVEDDLFMDNQRRVAVAVADATEVLVIDPGTGQNLAAAESYFLITALGQSKSVSSSPVRLNVNVAYLQDAPRIAFDESKIPVVVVANAGSLTSANIERLAAFAKNGGSLLIFAGNTLREDTATRLNELGLSPGNLLAPRRAGAMPFRITRISARGNMLSPFRDPQTGDIGRLAFTSLQATELHADTNVLAWFDQDQPAITDQPLGDGRIVWFLSAVDDSASNWTTSPLYLPILQQMVGDLLGMTGEGLVRYRKVGDARPIGHATSNTDSNAKIDLQHGFGEPGFESQNNVTYVVNTDPRESDPARVTVEQFLENFELTPQSKVRKEDDTVATQTRDEMWPWLAALLVVLFVAEYGLANRTPA